MLRHLAPLGAIVAFFLGLMFYPFLPGSHDGLATTLSFMAQLFGFAGSVLLVPIGLLWLVHELRLRAARNGNRLPRGNGRFYFALAAMVTLSIVALITTLPAFGNISRSLGVALVALWAWLGARAVPAVKGLRGSTAPPIHPAPAYLILVPALVLAGRVALIERAVAWSRARAIANSAPLIHDLEAYRERNGQYPVSLAALWHDYAPGVIGVARYEYEPSGASFNLFFEQFAAELATREIVVYNPLDQQVFTSHDSWILVLPPAELDKHRGYFAVHPAPIPRWKYFWFD